MLLFLLVRLPPILFDSAVVKGKKEKQRLSQPNCGILCSPSTACLIWNHLVNYGKQHFHSLPAALHRSLPYWHVSWCCWTTCAPDFIIMRRSTFVIVVLLTSKEEWGACKKFWNWGLGVSKFRYTQISIGRLMIISSYSGALWNVQVLGRIVTFACCDSQGDIHSLYLSTCPTSKIAPQCRRIMRPTASGW